MSDKGHALVAWNWALVRPQGERLAEVFYASLFEIAPSTRAMFASVDMKVQGHKVVAMLDEIVRSVDDREWLERNVGALGQRHAAYHEARRGGRGHGAVAERPSVEAVERGWDREGAALHPRRDDL